MFQRFAPYAVSVVILSALAGCAGAIGGPTAGENDGSGGQGGLGGGAEDPILKEDNGLDDLLPSAADCSKASAKSSPSRRLTNEEYDRTIADLFSGTDVGKPSKDFAFPSDFVYRHLFNNDANNQKILRGHAQGYADAAEFIATKLAANLPALLGCDPVKEADADCAEKFIEGFGMRAFRRPLTNEESTRLKEFYRQEKGAAGVQSGVTALLSRVLVSPQFLYRIENLEETGASPSAKRVDPYSLASRLSYMLTGTMPDAELFAAAKAGALTKDEELTKHSQRLLQSPGARSVAREFFAQLLETFRVLGQVKDSQKFPGFGDAITNAMKEEAERFAENQFFSSDNAWKGLMTSPKSPINGTLAKHYGIAGVSGSSDYTDMELKHRSGIITLGAVLTANAKADQSSVIFRGKWVRERLLCWDTPEVPLNVPPFPEPQPGLTNRQLTEQHRSNPACNACHRMMDPIGFALEHFDATGRWREQDEGQSIDDAGEIVDTGDADGQFKGAQEMGQKLAQSKFAQGCMAMRFFQKAVGREPDEADACAIRKVASAFMRNGSFKDAVDALVHSDAMRVAGNP